MYPQVLVVHGDGSLDIPAYPIIPFIEGDDPNDPQIWAATQRVMDAAVKRCYGAERAITWIEVFIGEKAFKQQGQYLPQESIEVLHKHVVSIKGGFLASEDGGNFLVERDLCQALDLYASIQPRRFNANRAWPLSQAGHTDIVVIHANSNQVSSSFAWQAGSPEAEQLITLLRNDMKAPLRDNCGICVQPVSEFDVKRLLRKAMQYALDHQRPSLTLVCEGQRHPLMQQAMLSWARELVAEEFTGNVLLQDQLHIDSQLARSKRLIVEHVAAETLFPLLLLKPQHYSVLVSLGPSGEYLAHLLAAQSHIYRGAPSAYVGDGLAMFTAQSTLDGQGGWMDAAYSSNPSGLIMAGAMLLAYLGWNEAATLLHRAFDQTAAQMLPSSADLSKEAGASFSCIDFAATLVANMG